jgi:tetratricopeptide (TPR) repeat protein
MNWRGWCFCAVVLCAVTTAHSQTSLPDSIANLFINVPRDSNYIIQLNKLASDYLKTNPSLTRRIATHATELAPETKYAKGHARSLTIIGNSYWYEGVFEIAQNYYLLAARQYESIHDNIGLGLVYNNIGEVYKKMGDNKKALEFLTASADLKKNDLSTQALTLYNIGELYILMNDLPAATQYIEQSLSFAIQHNDRRTIGYAYTGLGLILAKQKKPREALDYFIRSEKIWKEISEMRLLIQAYQDMSDAYREMKLFDEAEKYLSLSMEMSSLIKAPDLLVNNYLRLSKLDSARGNHNKALVNLYRYTTLKDSVYNLAKTEQIARLQMVFESEAKERENNQLKSEQLFRESQLKLQRQIIYAISTGLLLTGVMAWFLYRQRHKILSVNKILNEKNSEINTQKLAIEMQATALIKLNEDLQALNRNLEERIEQRTGQLTIQNQKLIEYAFVNAHKLRAPISSILGLINLMDQATPEEQSAIFTHLKTCGVQLDNITRQISRDLEGSIVDH